MRLGRQNTVIAILTVSIIALVLVRHFNRAAIVEPNRSITSASEAPGVVDRVGPAAVYPDPTRTPGAVNPDITQANIYETICSPNWSTKLIRPPESYTTQLKIRQMGEWALAGARSDYEEDHLISLELGGNPTDPRNLWPEPYFPKPGAREKDVVERRLHKQVCDGTMTLDQAQKAITADWYRIYLTIVQ